jgi:hypothetical protein
MVQLTHSEFLRIKGCNPKQPFAYGIADLLISTARIRRYSVMGRKETTE